jgi:hypothetical protein
MLVNQSLPALTSNRGAEDVPAGQVWQASLFLGRAARLPYAKDQSSEYNRRNSQAGEVGDARLELRFVGGYPKGAAPSVLAGDDGESAVVIFRGTVTGKGWDTNVWGRLNSFFPAQIHYGFLRLYDSLPLDLLYFVRSARTEKKRRLGLAGHSLGGAQAVHGGLALWGLEDSYTPGGLVTFGAPRGGAERFGRLRRQHASPPALSSSPTPVTSCPRAGPRRLQSRQELLASETRRETQTDWPWRGGGVGAHVGIAEDTLLPFGRSGA